MHTRPGQYADVVIRDGFAVLVRADGGAVVCEAASLTGLLAGQSPFWEDIWTRQMGAFGSAMFLRAAIRPDGEVFAVAKASEGHAGLIISRDAVVPVEIGYGNQPIEIACVRNQIVVYSWLGHEIGLFDVAGQRVGTLPVSAERHGSSQGIRYIDDEGKPVLADDSHAKEIGGRTVRDYVERGPWTVGQSIVVYGVDVLGPARFTCLHGNALFPRAAVSGDALVVLKIDNGVHLEAFTPPYPTVLDSVEQPPAPPVPEPQKPDPTPVPEPRPDVNPLDFPPLDADGRVVESSRRTLRDLNKPGRYWTTDQWKERFFRLLTQYGIQNDPTSEYGMSVIDVPLVQAGAQPQRGSDGRWSGRIYLPSEPPSKDAVQEAAAALSRATPEQREAWLKEGGRYHDVYWWDFQRVVDLTEHPWGGRWTWIVRNDPGPPSGVGPQPEPQPEPQPPPSPGPQPDPKPGPVVRPELVRYVAGLRQFADELAKLPAPTPQPQPSPEPQPCPLPHVTEGPSYDEMMRMAEAVRKAHGRKALPPDFMAHLVWRFLNENYSVEQLVAEVKERA